MKIKEKSVEMCSLIYKYDNHPYKFPYETFLYSSEYSSIKEDKEEYNLLLLKMENLIKLINTDNKYIEMDIENELWFLI